MGIWKDLLGTTSAFFRIGLSGVRLKNNSGNLDVRNAADAAYADVTAKTLKATDADVILDSDGNALTVSRNAAQSGALQIIFPSGKGSDGQVIRQKASTGAGIIEFEWANASDTSMADKVDTTSLAYNSAGTVTMFNTGANDVIEYIDVTVGTAFDGTGPTPSMSVGINGGSASKYVGANQVDLTVADTYRVHPGLDAQGVEALEIAFTAGGGATVGAARVLVHYATPA